MNDKTFTAYTDSLSQIERPITFQQKLSKEQAQTDFQILQRILEEAHTPMYRYTSQKVIDSLFQYHYQSIGDSITYLNLIRKIADIQHHIACGHSGWGHSKAYKQFRDEFVKLFPLDIEIVEGRYFVKNDNSFENQIEVGSEITHINSIPVTKLTAQLKKYMGKDGNSNPNGTSGVATYFSNAYSNFWDNPSKYVLKLSNAEKGESNITVYAQVRYKIDSVRTVRNPTREKNILPLQFYSIDSLNTAVLTIKSFNKEYIAHKGQDLPSFLDLAFRILERKNTPNLIIDLRDNTGGWTAHGKLLFSYFIDQEVNYIDNVRIKKYKDFSFESLITSTPKYLDTFDLQLNEDSSYNWVNYPSLKASPKKENLFKGHVSILINDMTRSCSAVFSSLMKEHTNVQFIGEETGATYGASNGMVMNVQLPYSGINISFSTAEYTCAVTDINDYAGIVPNYIVKKSVNDIGSKNDIELRKALEIVNK